MNTSCTVQGRSEEDVVNSRDILDKMACEYCHRVGWRAVKVSEESIFGQGWCHMWIWRHQRHVFEIIVNSPWLFCTSQSVFSFFLIILLLVLTFHFYGFA